MEQRAANVVTGLIFVAIAAIHGVVWAATGQFMTGLLAVGLVGLALGVFSIVAVILRRS